MTKDIEQVQRDLMAGARISNLYAELVETALEIAYQKGLQAGMVRGKDITLRALDQAARDAGLGA